MTPKPTITLAIETSNPSRTDGSRASVALVEGADPLALRVLARTPLTRTDSRDDALVRAIDACARDAGVGPREISRIAVSVGPGGYTTVRIAVSVAKSIASVTGAACVRVPTAMGIVEALDGRLPATEAALVCLAWKRGETWAEPWRDGAPAAQARIMTVDDVGAFACGAIVAEAAFAEKLREAAPALATPIVEPEFDPIAVARVSFACETVAASALVPLYPREPEAVRVWAERHGR